MSILKKKEKGLYQEIEGIVFQDILNNKEHYLIKGNPRTRRLKKNEIQQLFQGKNPRTGEVIYPGDEKIKSEDSVTVQIHNLDLRDTELENIITIAVWIPARLSQLN